MSKNELIAGQLVLIPVKMAIPENIMCHIRKFPKTTVSSQEVSTVRSIGEGHSGKAGVEGCV